MVLLALGDAVTVAVLVGLVAGHTVLAAVAARFFRIRLATRWGSVLYTLLAVPVLYVLTTLLVLGALGVGGDLRLDRGTLLLFFWGLPLALGVSIDWFWLPAPEELPAARTEQNQR